MRCNHCGKDFGDGLNCQYCGIDRVEGLGSFNGFDPDTKGVSHLSPGSTTPGGISVTDSKNMLCYSCGEIIPGDSVFCPICRTRLYVTCPKCGRSYSSQYDNCNQCGTNRQDYLDKLEQEKQKKLREEAEKQKIESLKRKEEQERQRREEAARRRREDEAREQKERQEAQKRQLIVMARDSENKWVERFISNNAKQLSRYYKAQYIKKNLLGSDVYERGLFGIFGGFFLAFLNGAIGFEAIKFSNENKAILRYVQNAFYEENGRPFRYTNSWVIITTCIKYGIFIEIPSSPKSLNLRQSYEQQTDAEVDINWTKPFIVTALLGICFSIFFVWPYPPMPKGSESYSGTAVVTMGDPLSSNAKKQNVPISKMVLSFDSRKGFINYSAYSLELTIRRMYREEAEIHIVLEERDLKNPVKDSKLGDGISAVYEGVIHSYGTFSGSGKNWKGQYFSFDLKPIQ